MFFITIFLICVSIIILISLIKIKAVIKIHNNNILITVFILKFIKIRKEYIIKREKTDILSLYEIKKNAAVKIKTLNEIIRNFIKSELSDKQKYSRKKGIVFIYKKSKIYIRLNLSLGLNDAYTTAMVCGFFDIPSNIICGAKSSKKRKIKVHIKPEFSKQHISIKADCIIELTPANIIIGYIIYKKK